jgi:APA family basic amino acid/polyamine antiporter
MAAVLTPRAGPELRRELGFWSATAMVVGNMVGSGVFMLPAAMAAVVLVYGSSSLLAWLVSGIGAILLGLVFAQMGRRYPRTGGPYVYARRAFGDFVGFQTAWGYWIAAWVGNAAIATVFVGYLTVLWPSLGDTQLGVRQGGWVQMVTTLLKFVPLFLIGVIGLFSLTADHFTPFMPAGLQIGRGVLTFFEGVTAAVGLTLWAFIGLESATVPAEEIRDPERTIPRATIVGTLATTAVYILATIAVMGVLPMAALADSSAPFADAAGSIFGGTWAKWVGLLGAISAFGALNGWTLLTARISLAAAEDGVFPRVFGRVSSARHTPVWGLVIAAALVTGLTFMNYTKSLVDQFTFVILLATLVTVVPYAMAAAAELFLMIREPARFAGMKMVRNALVALLGFGYSVWAMYATGYMAIGQGYLLLMAGIPLYAWVKWRRSKGERIPLRTEQVPQGEFELKDYEPPTPAQPRIPAKVA